MERTRLLALLRELHEDLSQQEQVDPETLALLKSLTDDIDRLSEQSGEEEEPSPPEEVDSVRERLREVLINFEAEHPRLSKVIEQVTDRLGNFGI